MGNNKEDTNPILKELVGIILSNSARFKVRISEMLSDWSEVTQQVRGRVRQEVRTPGSLYGEFSMTANILNLFLLKVGSMSPALHLGGSLML